MSWFGFYIISSSLLFSACFIFGLTGVPFLCLVSLNFFFLFDLLLLNYKFRYVLTTHTNNSHVRVTKVGYDQEAYDEAMRLPVCTEGECIPLDEEGEVVLRKRSNGHWGVSFAVENRSGVAMSNLDKKKKNKKNKKNKKKNQEENEEVDTQQQGQTMHFTLDCSSSTNVVSSPFGLEAGTQVSKPLESTVTVKPGETKVLHHLVPKDQGPWTWKYSANWEFV